MIESGPSEQSQLRGVSLEYVKTTHLDNRRKIVEFYNQDVLTFANARVIKINPPKAGGKTVLGGHFHRDSELLFVLYGKIDTLKLQDVDTNDGFVFTNIGKGVKVFLPSRIAHELIFSSRATLIALREDIYTPDTLIPHQIILPHL